MRDPKEIEKLRAEVQRRLAETIRRKAEALPVSPAPRYDDVYFEGVAALNRMDS